MNRPSPDWTALPEAAALLADCAANPPSQRYAKGIFGPNDGAMIYDDERVKKLRQIHRREAARLLDTPGFEAHARLSVQSAIEQAIHIARAQFAPRKEMAA